MHRSRFRLFLLTRLVVGMPLVATSETEAVEAWVITIDKTGSMTETTLSCNTSMTRCACAIQKAEAQIQSIFNGNPNAEVAVVTFGNPEVVAQNFTTNQALVEAAVAGPCTSNTPLADAACLAGDILGANYAGGGNTRSMLLLTDGGENASDGPCGVGDWQDNVLTNLSSTNNAVVDVGYFGAVGPISRSIDNEGGAIVRGILPDAEFFQALAAATGGSFTFFADSGASSVPALSAPGVALLTLGFMAASAFLLWRRL